MKDKFAKASKEESELDITLRQAKRDVQTVDKSGERVDRPLDGMLFHEVVRHRDDRGSVVELFDPRWGWHPAPLVFAYLFAIRPGIAKGWGLHKEHEDRYFVIAGEMEVVLYDPRPESSTYKKICRVVLSADRPRLMNVPRNVWHADYNFGDTDVVVVNFPTIQYDHTNPDKYRLPLDTDLIPFDFGHIKGW
jgi:dTDP-4-dehydrorhamnose 3,5-epimerase